MSHQKNRWPGGITLITALAGVALAACSPAAADDQDGAGEQRGTSTAGAASACGWLKSGESLARGESVQSCNGKALLAHQTDGNVVEYDPAGALWSTATNGKPTSTLAMQGDGNLVLYGTSGQALWHTSTHGHPGASLAVQDDCNLVIYSVVGQILWQTSRFCRNPPAPPFEYPVNGQTIDFEGSYVLRATAIPGATGYLIGMFQNGVLQYENYRDSGLLSRDVALARGSPHRSRLLPNIPTVVTVRGLVNGQWTPAQQITITLRPRAETVKVLELKYFPLDANGNLDSAETGVTATLAQIRSTVNGLSSGTEQSLEQGSTSVKQQGIGPYLNYQKVASFEYLERVPRSAQFAPFADHFAMLNRVDICNYVDVQGVRDVWIWMYHTASVAPIESNMSMGTTSSSWYNHGTYGDISNSYRHDDLPRCNNTYVVYDFNYGRGVAEAIHNYGHQQEALLGYADAAMFSQFVNPYGPVGGGARACGNVHNPPNSTADYDYGNAAAVVSRCSDWRPDGTGATESVSCSSWGCAGDPHRSFLVWWFQRIPGRGTTLAKNGVRLRNWNEFLWDFDKAIRDGRRLTE